MSIYIISPYIKTGCVESLHQLSYHLTREGFKNYIVYTKKDNIDGPVLYKDLYDNIEEWTSDIPESSLVIIFESMKYKDIEKHFKLKNCKYIIWWFSFLSALQYESFTTNISNDDIIHLFQGEYVKNMVVPRLPTNQKWFYLHDYIHSDFKNYKPLPSRDDLIAYNPVKDFISGEFLIMNNYRTLPLVDLEREYIIQLLANCKIYVDLSANSGRDRFHREAATLGCVVITNELGSTQTETDIKIPSFFKVKSKEELKNVIDKVLENYELYYEQQKEYRKGLHQDEKRMVYQIRYIFGQELFSKKYLSDEYIKNTDITKFIHEYDHLLDEALCIECSPKIVEEVVIDTNNMLVAGDEKTHHTIYMLKMNNNMNVKRVDLNHSYIDEILEKLNPKYSCERINFLEFETKERYDTLVIDMFLYNYGTLMKILNQWETYIDKYIIITNTEFFRDKSNCYTEDDKMIEYLIGCTGFTKQELNDGLLKGVYDFLDKTKDWKKIFDYKQDLGVVILKRV